MKQILKNASHASLVESHNPCVLALEAELKGVK
jgi:hypothetical protein